MLQKAAGERRPGDASQKRKWHRKHTLFTSYYQDYNSLLLSNTTFLNFCFVIKTRGKWESKKLNLSKVFPRTSFLSNFWFVFYISKLLQQVPNTPSVITSVSFSIYKTITGNDHCSLLSSLAASHKIV